MVGFAGCITSDTGDIEGQVYNTTDLKVKLKAHCTTGVHQDIWRTIYANDTDKFWLYVGTWEITVWWDASGDKLDDDTLIVQKIDDWFEIMVYNTTILCDAY